MSDQNIRKMVESDKAWVAMMLGDSKVAHFLPFDPMDLKQAEERFHSYLDLNQNNQNSSLGSYVLEALGEPAGYGFMRPYEWEPESKGIEIGYLIDPSFWGKGIGGVLASFLVNSAQDQTVLALIDDKNIASQKIVQGLGFYKKATSKKYQGNSIWVLERENG